MHKKQLVRVRTHSSSKSTDAPLSMNMARRQFEDVFEAVFEAGRGGGGLFQIIIWKRVRFDQRSLKLSLIIVPESRHHGISPLKKNLCLKTLSDTAGSHPLSI
jgi:hypothetical protein